MALPKENRIKKKKDFERIFKTGAVLKNDFFLVKAKRNNLPLHRGAIVVPVSVASKATERNKIKRIISEALQNFFSNIKTKENKIDVIIVSRHDVKNKNFQEICRSLRDIFRKANIV